MSNWNGEERRNGDEKLHKINTELSTFKATVTEWMSSTTEYRKLLCAKIDTIIEKFSKLPCDKRAGFYESISRQITAVWAILVLIIGAIIASWIKK